MACLLLPQICRLQLPVSCQSAIGAWPQVPESEIADISAWLPVLKCHQHGHHKQGHTVLEDQVHGYARYLSTNEMTNDIHHCCRPQHDKQVLKFQEHEGHSRLQISVNRCHV